MRAMLSLAVKDLRVLSRVRSAMFFTFAWPVAVAVIFGFVFAGAGPGESGPLRVVLVDEDGTDASRAFAARLEASGDFALDERTRAEAEQLVRRGQRAAFVVLQPGFGAASAQMFTGPSRPVELGIDPARQAEAGMIDAMLMKHAMADVEQALAVKTSWQPLALSRTPVARQARPGPSNSFEVTFPQGVLWGIIGCVMTFAVGLVSERVRGTFVRLRMSPLTSTTLLGGKAVACFVSILVIEVILFALGYAAFDVRPASWGLLVVAGLATAVAFVGFMMMVAGFGRTEQAVAGAGWALLMPMAMLGGAMVPQFIMPGWMLTLSHLSPIKWAILGFEGAVWRGFSAGEMVLPVTVLVSFGLACFAVGVRGLRDA